LQRVLGLPRGLRSSGSTLSSSRMSVLLTLSLRLSPATLRRKLISAACIRDLILSVTTQICTLHLSSPERFSGESGDCRPFISQCELHIEFNAASFSSDQAEIAFIISHLTGRATRFWATAEWSRRSAMCNSLAEFIKIFTQIFQSTSPGREAARSLVSLRQGKRSVTDYTIEFRTIAADNSWNQPPCDGDLSNPPPATPNRISDRKWMDGWIIF
uniref:DUF4939 domain-containing protein n=1 Tax=Mola mola TaxID=94237 RepID=A0A3Q3W915_MOLML